MPLHMQQAIYHFLELDVRLVLIGLLFLHKKELQEVLVGKDIFSADALFPFVLPIRCLLFVIIHLISFPVLVQVAVRHYTAQH